MQHFALTIIGRDRPGIVSSTAEIIYKLGCNIADSSNNILGGQFAMILILSHPEINDAEQLAKEFSSLEEQGLSVFVRTLKPGGEKRPELSGEACMISVYGSDKPGLVYKVAKVLSELNVNIVDLSTKLIGSAERPVYVIMCETVLPEELSVDKLKESMESLKQQLQVDISVRTVTPVEL
ncbi:MAG: amino acid-binding protein [Desulfobacteraceae bacterium 4572_35.1]|nr:MAG: amino acid-binding protein [Desulfobacteraceae bacterium 4572_35.1]